jgi:ATP-dependent DNA ligase
LFKAACDMMLEGLVSKRHSRYRPGPSRDWIKVNNPKSPAMNRAKAKQGNGRRAQRNNEKATQPFPPHQTNIS